MKRSWLNRREFLLRAAGGSAFAALAGTSSALPATLPADQGPYSPWTLWNAPEIAGTPVALIAAAVPTAALAKAPPSWANWPPAVGRASPGRRPAIGSSFSGVLSAGKTMTTAPSSPRFSPVGATSQTLPYKDAEETTSGNPLMS